MPASVLPRPRLLACALALATVLVALAAGAGNAAAASSGFSLGFSDGVWDTSPVWFDRTVAAGGRFVLQAVEQGSIAGARPSGDPTNPANPAYNWGTLDQAVRGAAAHGLTVALSINSAGGVGWMDAPGRPRKDPPGTWRPNPAEFGQFVKAVARRYSGRFNPGGGVLPHVRYYQAWSEPNLPDHLNPQWVKVGRHWRAASPIIYRALLNSAYAAVKSVDRSDQVITAGTAPFGDPPGGLRVPPALFLRSMLCLGGSVRKPTLGHCSDPPHFDILAHHPYATGGPFAPAGNPDDVSLPDMWKLERELSLAQRTGRAPGARHKRIWVTEFSWDSRPPDPHGVPMRTWERWTQESFYELWRENVSAIAWYLLVDQPCTPDCADSYQSGVYYTSGQAKAGIEAFRFPFVVEPSGGRNVVWGITPRSGTVLVQEKRSGRWVTVLRFHKRAHEVFTRAISLSGHPLMRARVGGENSIGF